MSKSYSDTFYFSWSVEMIIDSVLKAIGARTLDRYEPLEVNFGC